jgi:glycosyltransferase involved in cell wall biosynthesis
MSAAPRTLSVIIPARDAAATLGACLDGVLAQADADIEVIVVDDGSLDATAAIAAGYPVTLVRCDRPHGVAAARNRGAAVAGAPLLFFLDADVVPAPGALARALAAFDDPDLHATFGSYDDDPAVRSTVSRFKNLCHHYFHQRARRDATTFWGACGAIRREHFEAAGGFNERRYRQPSIEDVELGQRLVERGARIVADPGLQVKHLKRWTLASLLATDVRRRAIPWTQLIMERRRWPADLNLTRDQITAAVIALALLGTAPFLARPMVWMVGLGLLASAIVVNRDLYRLFARRGGLRLALAGFALQQLYYLYATAGFAAGLGLFAWRRLVRRSSSAASRPEACASPPGPPRSGTSGP